MFTVTGSSVPGWCPGRPGGEPSLSPRQALVSHAHCGVMETAASLHPAPHPRGLHPSPHGGGVRGQDPHRWSVAVRPPHCRAGGIRGAELPAPPRGNEGPSVSPFRSLRGHTPQLSRGVCGHAVAELGHPRRAPERPALTAHLCRALLKGAR